MRCSRVYIDTPLSTGLDITLSPDTARYVATVLRRKQGQELHVFNGLGGHYLAEIISINKRSVIVRTQAFFNEDRESPLHITLVQGVSRGQHMDYTIQKAVELGVNRIVPVFTEHSNVRLDEQRKERRLEHWRKIIISACEQCGRDFLPELITPMPLPDWFANEQASLKLMFEPGATGRLSELDPQKGDISVLSGPEGGFSDTEVETACAKGYQTIKFGPRILRTETAAVAILAAVQTLWGDMG